MIIWQTDIVWKLLFNPLAAVGDISRLPARVREADFVAREFDRLILVRQLQML